MIRLFFVCRELCWIGSKGYGGKHFCPTNSHQNNAPNPL